MTQPGNIPGLITEIFDGITVPREDVTEFQRGPVAITRGRADESTDTEAGQMTLTLDNRDGRFSPRNPASPYFGELGRNTVIRCRFDTDVVLASGIRLRNPTGDVSTVLAWAFANDAPSLDVTDIDVRIEITPDTWAPTVSQVLMAKYTLGGGGASWFFALGVGGTLRWIWSADGTNGVATNTSAALPAGLTSLRRGAVRITFDVDNGAGGKTASYYWATSLDGPWTLFSQLTTAGTTSIFSGSGGIGVGANALGSRVFVTYTSYSGMVHRAEVRNGIDGTVITSPNFREYVSILQKIADVVGGLADAQGHVYFLEGQTEVERPDIRAAMEAVRWAPRWDVSGQDSEVEVEAAGVLRRLGSPGRSQDDAIRRFMLSGEAPNILGYWSLTDPEGSRVAASAIGGDPMKAATRATDPQFGRGELAWWLPASLLTGEVSGGGALRAVITGSTTGGWALDVLYRTQDPSSWGDSAPQKLAIDIIDSGGTGHLEGIIWRAFIDPETDTLQLGAIDVATGSTIAATTTDIGNVLDGNPHHFRMRATEGAGTDTNIFLDVDRVNAIAFTLNIGITTTPAPISVRLNWQSPNANFAVPLNLGHLAVFNSPPPGLFDVNDAYIGYDGEAAAERWRRVVTQEGLSPVVFGDRFDSPPMGPQPPATGLELMRLALATDGGTMFETRDWPSVALAPLSYLTNRDALLTLDYDARQVGVPFHPDEDDQNLRNDVTAQRLGSDDAARVVQTTGPLSVLDPPFGVGPYPERVDVSVQSSDQLAAQAGIRVHRGTWNGSRYPQLAVAIRFTDENLKLTELRDAMLLADSGRRVDVTNLPSWLPPEDAQLMIQGYQETITPEDVDSVFNSSPYGPYIFGVAGDDGENGVDASRVDTDGSILATQLVAGTDTSMLVATTDGPVWSTDDANEYPDGFDVVLTEGSQQAEGAIMRVTDIASFTLDNWNRVIAASWGSTSTGAIAWVNSGTATNVTFSVNGSRGIINRTAAGSSYESLTGVSLTDVEVLVSVESSVASGTVGVILRFGAPAGSDLANGYGVVINGATAALEVYRNVTGGVGATLIGSSPLVGWTSGTQWRIRARVVGTTIYAKAWSTGSFEFDGWRVIVTDTTHSGGSVAMQRVGSGQGLFDNLDVTSPQVFTIEQQAINGVTRVVPVGAGVRLAHPTYPGL